jgi:uncharacterized surface protein with fasciclin (FAS1) repeats
MRRRRASVHYRPNKDELTSVLSHHLIPGRSFASSWASEEVSIETKGGQTLMINGNSSPFKIATLRW